jgi:hypothetical protein
MKNISDKALQFAEVALDTVGGRESTEEDDWSPVTELPLHQQRDNFFS